MCMLKPFLPSSHWLAELVVSGVRSYIFLKTRHHVMHVRACDCEQETPSLTWCTSIGSQGCLMLSSTPVKVGAKLCVVNNKISLYSIYLQHVVSSAACEQNICPKTPHIGIPWNLKALDRIQCFCHNLLFRCCCNLYFHFNKLPGLCSVLVYLFTFRQMW